MRWTGSNPVTRPDGCVEAPVKNKLWTWVIFPRGTVSTGWLRYRELYVQPDTSVSVVDALHHKVGLVPPYVVETRWPGQPVTSTLHPSPHT